MSEPKPFASLSSGLLARKGAAKPAMRPQAYGSMNFGLEDLGWNDMEGAPAQVHALHPDDEVREHKPSSIAALTPARKSDAGTEEQLEESAVPAVIEQQRAIEASFIDEARPAPASKAAAEAAVIRLPARPRQAAGSKDKAAFTLRLDTQRHLKLRLACAVTHRSAQQIVSQALDTYLASLPELETLANQVPAKRGNRN